MPRKKNAIGRERGKLTPHEEAIIDLLRLGYRQKLVGVKLNLRMDAIQSALSRARAVMECETTYQLIAEFAVARALAKLEKKSENVLAAAGSKG